MDIGDTPHLFPDRSVGDSELLKTDREKSLDVLCDVEEYEYRKRNGLPDLLHLSGWEFHLTMWIFNILYGEGLNFKLKINNNNNKSKVK